MAMEKWVCSLDQVCKEDGLLVGKKCANLGELTKAGFQVPKGFVLGLEAYRTFMNLTGAGKEIREYFASFTADPNYPKDFIKYQEASQFVGNLMASKKMPDEMGHLIVNQYENLCCAVGINELPVATRSAGPASHPGQYETYLHIRGHSQVTANIAKVWSSTFNARSLVARARAGLPLYDDPIGVLVLQMVNAKAAGVMFTLNPMDGDLSKVIVEGNWGLGESVVSGEVIPDRWTVDKVLLEVEKSEISQKLFEYNLDPRTSRPSFVPVPVGKQRVPCLNREELLELCRTGKKVEDHFGTAQDIEWAVDNDLKFPKSIFLLQCRPERVWNKKATEPKLKMTTSSWGEVLSSVLTTE